MLSGKPFPLILPMSYISAVSFCNLNSNSFSPMRIFASINTQWKTVYDLMAFVTH